MAGAQRRERLSEFVLQEVAKILLTEMEDPRLKRVVVTRAEVSDDIQSARIYVRVIGTEGETRTALRALDGAAGKIQSEVAHRMETRYTPRIKFFLDEKVEEERRLYALLDKVRKERGEDGPEPPASGGEPG